jgi:hypothetical protein
VTCVGERKGSYYNFETSEGGNLLQLVEKKNGLNRTEAVAWVRDFLNDGASRPIPSHFSTSSFKRVIEESWISLMPSAQAQIPSLGQLSTYLEKNYRLAATYPYRNASGEPVFYTLRLESKSDEKKIVLPLSYGKSHTEDEPVWKLKTHQAKSEMLYNMHLLHQHPEKPVLIVEGEKTANEKAIKRGIRNLSTRENR